jgi:hypothetical protein
MRRRLLALMVTVAIVVPFAPAAIAEGPGGWDHLGNGGASGVSALNSHVNALNSSNPGILYAGGAFTDAGGKARADHLAQWDGSSWSAVNGSTTLNGAVDAIAYQAGHVYVGGEFTNVGGNDNIDFLAEWTGTAWKSPCVSTGPNPPITAQVTALQIIGNTLYVGGTFQNGAEIPAADFLVACDLTTGVASATVSHDSDFNSGVYALTADSNGTLYAGGGFINLEGVTGLNHVAYYQGGTWHQMGAGNAVDDIVRSLAAHGTDVYVGTDAININGIENADHIARWDAQNLAYSALGSNTAGTNGWFDSFAFLYGMTTSGSLVFAAGSFQNANGTSTADDIAYFDGTAWHALGSDGAGNGPLNSNVIALAAYNHRIVAGGNFTNAGGDALADAIGSHVLLRPDARVGTDAGGPFTGNNIYSATGSGESKSISVKRGHSGKLFVDVQNDGLTAASLAVTGPHGSHGFDLHYFQGASNVTAQVLSGTFSTGSLQPGAHLTLKVVIDVAHGSDNSGTFVVTARSGSGIPVDGVRLKVDAS